MKKTMLSLTAGLLAVAGMTAAPVFAGDLPISLAVQAMPHTLDFSSPLAQIHEENIASAANVAPRPLAPAPPLTRELVYAVGSTDCGWEYMTTIGQISTVCNHGGTQLRAVVQEIGYGGTPFAWLNGGILPSTANYQNDPICIVGSYYTSPCPAGYTIVGYYRYFNLDGNQSGSFTYQNTSVNSPFNTLSTGINIQ